MANAVFFQLGWFACVLSIRQPGLLLAACALLLVQLLWICDRGEWRAVLAVAAVGWLIDSIWLQLGVLTIPNVHNLLPLWLAMLWLLFATTLRHSLGWTARHWWLSSLLGALGGPLSYLSGATLAGLGVPWDAVSDLLLLSLSWALLLPALHGLTRSRWLQAGNRVACGKTE